ncbi:general odorant-binding protein 45-like [Armigeres subalbatus]|uniref:general odorant-binding protein 45-like n=1 Tax=Armigeres subalbatus TaxID=124917 RepID=UPI002ECFC7D5
MKCVPPILFLFLAAPVVKSALHCAVVKHPYTLYNECVQYLEGNGDTESCTYRCIGLTARFWDDQQALVTRTVSRFYLTSANDTDFRNRTDHCLQEAAEDFPISDICQRATCSVSCYDDQFGELISERPSFIPFTDVVHRRVVQECLDIFQIGESLRKDMLENGLLSLPEGRCLLRCVLLREGLYNDRRGPRLGWLWVQTEGYEEVFYDTAQKCFALLKYKTLEPCELAARFAAECLPSRLPLVDVVYAVLSSLDK